MNKACVFSWLIGGFIIPFSCFGNSASTTDVKASIQVIIPNNNNLQWLNFYVAIGANYFADEGLTVELSIADAETDIGDALMNRVAEVAVLPNPEIIELIANKKEIVVFASLMRNDPINVVINLDVMDQIGLSPSDSLSARIKGLRGLRVGVAKSPVTRLLVLLETQEMVEADIDMIIVGGSRQNTLFGNNEIDVLYGHTPYMETALVEQEGVLFINQSAGEVSELSDRLVHGMVTSKDFAAAEREVVISIARAIYRAQLLIHTDLKATATALYNSGIEGLEDTARLASLLPIYQHAVPPTPEVTVQGIEKSYDLFPYTRIKPDLTCINLADYIDNTIVEEATATLSRSIKPDY